MCDKLLIQTHIMVKQIVCLSVRYPLQGRAKHVGTVAQLARKIGVCRPPVFYLFGYQHSRKLPRQNSVGVQLGNLQLYAKSFQTSFPRSHHVPSCARSPDGLRAGTSTERGRTPLKSARSLPGGKNSRRQSGPFRFLPRHLPGTTCDTPPPYDCCVSLPTTTGACSGCLCSGTSGSCGGIVGPKRRGCLRGSK